MIDSTYLGNNSEKRGNSLKIIETISNQLQ